MFKNYFKTAIRNLKRNKSYAIINSLGLAVGIAACLLIFLVAQFETSFDNFHSKKESIYRIGSALHSEDGVNYSKGVGFPVANGIRLDFPQIKEVASIFKSEEQVTIEEAGQPAKKFNEPNFYFAEPQFFNMFSFGWLAGSPATSLKDPTSAVLTRATAEKFFGDWKSAIGKTFKRHNDELYTVTGILQNVPVNSDFPLNVVVPYAASRQMKDNIGDWVSTMGELNTFVVLPQDLPVAKFNAELKTFAKKHKPAEYAKDAYVAQLLSEIHYDDRFGNFREYTFSHSLVTALLLIGLFLIVVACVNFINLATAQAVKRSKEVGVRKVLGSLRGQLAIQFMGETALLVSIAMIASVLVAYFSLPYLNKLLEVQISLNFFTNPTLLLFIGITWIVVTLLSGLYPAIILSGFNPITALKSKMTPKLVGGISLRRGLVVLQFAIAHVLIISMIIVVSQMNLFRSSSLGFNKASIINVPLPGGSLNHSKINYLRDKLISNPAIQNVSFSFGSPASEDNWRSDFKFDHAVKATNFDANLKWADAEYFKTFNLEFIAGRPYSAGDTVREFVVNETLLRKVGVTNPKDAIGKEINFWDGAKVANIVGVVRDFNVYSLKEPMSPVVLSTWKDRYQTINIKLKPGSEKSSLSVIEKLWNETYPESVYAYSFLDESIRNFYKQEEQLAQLYKIFAGIAIFISCLGLYGLVSFMAVQRTKEMGIRKVLGASAGNIVYLLSKEFTVLIVLAFVIAAPVAWYFMHAWLQNYTYRIPLTASIFILAILSSIIISWITVAQKAIKAAIANPVKSLRTE
ncbi:MAG: ABC transporter permease [Ginsengibacter sp.]